MVRKLLASICLLSFGICLSQSWEQTAGPYAARATAMTSVGDYIYVANRDYGGTDGSVYRSNNLGADWTRAASGIGAAYVLQFANIGETILAAAANLFGVFRTTNQGTTWQEIAGGIFAPALSVEAVGNDFWCGTEGGGVFKSVDNGLTFIPKNNGLGVGQVIVYDIEHLGNYLYLAVEGGGGPARLYRSSDYGESWQYSNTGLPLGTNPHKFAVNGTTLFVSCEGDFPQYEYGLYKSTDYGATWTPANNGIPTLLYGNTGEIWSHDGIVYVSVTFGNETPKVYKSMDDGENFIPASDGLRNVNQEIFAYTAKDGYIFAGSGWYGSVFRSSNQGDSWEEARRGLANATVFSLMEKDGRLYAGAQEGLFYTTDMGQNWTEVLNGLPYGLPVTTMIKNGTEIFFGTDQFGIYRSTDDANTWTQVNNGLTGTYAESIEQLLYHNGTIYAATWDGVYKSTNDGNSWTLASNGLPTEFGGGIVHVNTIMEHNGILYAGTVLSGIYKSTDNAASWTSISSGLTTYAMTIHKLTSVGDTLYAATDGGIYKSTNAGASWQTVPALNDGPWRALYAYENKIFASNYGPTVMTGYNAYQSNDGGETWTDVETGMFPDDRIMAFQVYNGSLFCGTDTRSVWKWSQPLQTQPFTNKSNLNLAPNPTKGVVAIEGLIDNADIRIFDAMGREVLRQVGKSADLSTLPSGIYLLRINHNSSAITRKVIKL